MHKINMKIYNKLLFLLLIKMKIHQRINITKTQNRNTTTIKNNQ